MNYLTGVQFLTEILQLVDCWPPVACCVILKVETIPLGKKGLESRLMLCKLHLDGMK